MKEFCVIGDFSENYAFLIQVAAQGFHSHTSQATIYLIFIEIWGWAGLIYRDIQNYVTTDTGDVKCVPRTVLICLIQISFYFFCALYSYYY